MVAGNVGLIQGLRFRIVLLGMGGTYQPTCEPICGLPAIGRSARYSGLITARLMEKRRRRKKKERAFEEEGEEKGELGEPRCELISTPFLNPDSVLLSLDDPDPGGKGEESRKEEDLEARGSGEVAVKVAEEAVSFISLFATLWPSSWLHSLSKVGDVRGLRRLCRLFRRMSHTRRQGEEEEAASPRLLMPFL